jgi:energy-coupling factor transporter ATP-binding protein EcfA2
VRWEPWARFRQQVRLRQGEHITIIGTTGSGKTVLARELLQARSYVVVLGTKNTDAELYEPFQAIGYELVGTGDFDAMPERDESRIIFRPRITTPDKKGRERQRDAFQTMLFEVWAAGGWTIYADEIWTLTNPLGLAVTFEEFWSAGRSEHITVVASTQEPVYIPRLAFTAATHLFLFQNPDQQRIDRIAELSAGNRNLVREMLPQLPQHEFLYINTRTRTVLRSKVQLGQ